jgi:hypothetical protein
MLASSLSQYGGALSTYFGGNVNGPVRNVKVAGDQHKP